MKKCALCGYDFDETSLTCHSQCPLARHCAIICCPHCGYQVVDESKSMVAAWAKKIRQAFNQTAAPYEKKP